MSSPPRAQVDEVADGIYRIATWVPETGITFNQFLIDDERPALIYTGMHQMYDEVRGGVSEVLDPARLAFVALLHFEADEWGAWTGSSPRRSSRPWWRAPSRLA